MEDRGNSLFSVVFLLCMAMAAAGCAVNPVTGQKQLVLVSQAQEIAMGRQQGQVWVQTNEGLFPDEALQRYVAAVGQKIAAVSHRPDLPYEFGVVNDPSLNAVTLPGGKTYLNRGLLAKLQNEDQLAALIAHEIGHSAAMHIATQITNQSVAGLALGGLQNILAEDGGQGNQTLLQGAGIGSQLLLLKFSRDMERQADNLAIEYLMAAGYNPNGALKLMETLKAGERRGLAIGFLQSHPLHDDRILAMQDRLGRLPRDVLSRPYVVTPFRAATRRLEEVREAFVWETRAREAYAQGDMRLAMQGLEKAIGIFPGYAPFYANLSSVQLKAGATRQAIASARKGQRLAPDLLLTQLAAGLAQFAARDYREALNALRMADRILPGAQAVRFHMAECHYHLKDFSRAVSLYAPLAQANPQSPEGRAAVARLQELGAVPS